jgi:hypothetical protein
VTDERPLSYQPTAGGETRALFMLWTSHFRPGCLEQSKADAHLALADSVAHEDLQRLPFLVGGYDL